ncbi:MAG: LTA synthase family protein [Agathobacter sp.]|nr:LTA synthase family protein [Agathobacter sp.]
MIWIILGFSNYLLLCNRVLPLTAFDLQLLDQLSTMMKSYLDSFTFAIASLGIIIVLLGFIILFFRMPKPKVKYSIKNQLIFFATIILLTFGNFHYVTSAGVLETHFYELPKSYLKNGFVYSFTLGIIDSGIDRVDGYSEDMILDITESFGESNPVSTPNIIILQLESFFDVNTLNTVTFSENPIPNFTNYAMENGSGLLTVPVIGAGTVNTEFEVMTGMRVLDFGAGEYPYKTILTETTCESIANNLKDYGYTSHFIHNYKGGFYGRNRVYANLGFHDFCSIENMSGYENNENGWARDIVLVKYINECLDETEGTDLVTAISVQAHGNYSGITDYEKHITVTSCEDESLKDSYEYYVNQVYETDAFVGELIDSLSQREEDVILVVYGDHLPSLEIENEDVDDRTIYQTDYFIWNNMGITYEDEDIYSYQISSKVLESLNITDGVINSCHQMYKGTDSYIDNLVALEYDVLYGEKYAYDQSNPYTIAIMQSDVRELVITDVQPKEGEEDTYIVIGEGFSPKTYVRVGIRIVITEYIDENTLEFRLEDYDGSIPISVWEKNVGDSNEFIKEE